MIIHLIYASLFCIISLVFMHAVLGRVIGISGIIHRSMVECQPWRYTFLLGMIITGFILQATHPNHFPTFIHSTNRFTCLRYLIAGFLVGYGSKYSCGCTSGHMLCGIARLSKRSFVASGTFFITALITHAITYKKSNELEIIKPLKYTTALTDGLQLLAVFIILSLLTYYRPFPLRILTPIIALFCGYCFAMAMGLSCMTKPSVVFGFFNFAVHPSAFIPDLLYFFLGALIPFFCVYQFYIKRMTNTILNEKMDMPTRSDITSSLIIGAIIFGAGWGLCGTCPGPALVDIGTLQYETFAFLVSMIIGFKCVS